MIFSTIETAQAFSEITKTDCKQRIKQGMTLNQFNSWLIGFIQESNRIPYDLGINKLELYLYLKNN